MLYVYLYRLKNLQFYLITGAMLQSKHTMALDVKAKKYTYESLVWI